MSMRKQTDNVVAAACVRCEVYFSCDGCNAVFTSNTASVYTAAHRAVAEGWRVDADGELRCPACTSESL